MLELAILNKSRTWNHLSALYKQQNKTFLECIFINSYYIFNLEIFQAIEKKVAANYLEDA